MKTYKPARFRRFLAFWLDWAVSFLAAVPFVLLAKYMPEEILMYLGSIGAIGVFALFFSRDYLLGGRSVGKRLLGLAVVDRKTGAPASGQQLLLKNLFFFLYPIDGGFLLFSGRSLGERATGAAVIRSREPAGPIAGKRFIKVAAVILAIAIPFAMLISFCLNGVKELDSYQIALEYLTASDAFAAQGAAPEDIALTAFSGYSRVTTEGPVTANEFTFQLGGEQYTVVCHPSEDSWAVCTECTDFE